jgi:protein-tyrosine-phosphatase
MFTLKEFVGDSQDLDIIDPYYESNSKFQEILGIIDEYIEKMVKKIRNLNEM